MRGSVGLLMIADRMLQLFRGNMDAYGSDSGSAVRAPVTTRLLDRHLRGEEGIGIYPIYCQQDKLVVNWGCADIDTGNWSEAYGLATVMNAMGIPPHIERSRSKGWHVWCFVETPVEAWVMRRALKVAYQAIDLPTKEVNPKSEVLAPGQLGNYVRLPYKAGALGVLGRQTMVHDWHGGDDGFPTSLASWVNNFGPEHYADPNALRHWASKFQEPTRKVWDGDMLTDGQLGIMLGKLMNTRPDLYEFVKNGPKHDRSAGLVSLAHQAKAAGMTPSEIYALVDVADQRWGKYVDRPNRDEYLRDIVERAL